MTDTKIIDPKKILFGKDNVYGIGNIQDKKGYQKVSIDIQYLEKIIEISKQFNLTDIEGSNSTITIFVKNDVPIQIGKEDIGVIIAPYGKN